MNGVGIEIMLKVTIEYIPCDQADKTKVIGQMEIINNGYSQHRPENGNYDVMYFEKGKPIKMLTQAVTEWPRERPVWELVKECLAKTLEK